MSKTTRKWILGVLIVVFLGVLSYTVRKSIKFEVGNHENYALAAKDMKIKNGIMVFCYHRILNDDATVKTVEALTPNNQLHVYNVNVSAFKAQMKFLSKHHIRVISTSQMVAMLHSHQPIRGKYVVLTFDDVDRTLTENAAPVMKHYGYPYTASIITGATGRYIGGEQLATWPQVMKTYRNAHGKMELGVHTNDMHYLVKGTPVFNLRKNYSKFKTDYATSQKVMATKLGHASSIFTYPYGSGTPQVENFLTAQPTLNVIYTLNNGIVTSVNDLRLTPRMIVTQDSWPSISRWLSR
ncbi:polysaccharide deacetylase family protein [Secundilactobacillus folii]|uniref:Polysaccharide deacetylase family protein n=1 Tax=Secundilactobacillus folii TaxID=2678357 RepID=A0A7X2XVT5_9LACO|nr:polysaccharide deacetylase family protein [Secundilactobacillus folii]MTV82533.1 polysaccharide deacetylase family protein [Secundilactobacillus folii]